MSLEFSMLNILPDEIRTLREKFLGLTGEMEFVNIQIKSWESAEMCYISSELDDKGKPVFSNAEKRQAELERRKSHDKDICRLENLYESTKRELELLRIELQYKHDIQENLRALSRVEGGQV